jgi:hypothetical protein
MALKKIELKLGKKVISLTPKEFEELKADMRALDKSHHYYWHTTPWYRSWYTTNPQISLLSTSKGAPAVGGSLSISNSQDGTYTPPAFSGSVLSTS